MVFLEGNILNIRTAHRDDAVHIKELVSSLSHFYLEDRYALLPEWFSNTLAISEFERRLSSNEFINYVYSVNGLIVGYISIKDKGHLYHLFVSEDYQGKGISKELWLYATSNLNVDSYTVRSSMYAIPVYKRFGFKESAPITSKDGISFQPMILVR